MRTQEDVPRVFKTHARQLVVRERVGVGGDGDAARRDRRAMASALERHSASRLASCPVCNKSTHVVLIHAHVERCLEQKRHVHGEASVARDARPGNVRGDGVEDDVRSTEGARPSEDDGAQRRVSSENRFESAGRASAPALGAGGFLRKLAAAKRARAHSPTANVRDGLGDFKRRALTDTTNRSIVSAVAAKTRLVDAATQTHASMQTESGPTSGYVEDDDVDVDKVVEDVEGGAPSSVTFELRVMSGNHDECGICLTPFDDAEGVTRHMFYPCQHVRQCGECALRVWQVPKAKRRCPWCKSKIEIRPRAFKPFL